MSGSEEFLGEKMPEADMKHYASQGVSSALRWAKALTDPTPVIDQLRQAADQLESLGQSESKKV